MTDEMSCNRISALSMASRGSLPVMMKKPSPSKLFWYSFTRWPPLATRLRCSVRAANPASSSAVEPE